MNLGDGDVMLGGGFFRLVGIRSRTDKIYVSSSNNISSYGAATAPTATAPATFLVFRPVPGAEDEVIE